MIPPVFNPATLGLTAARAVGFNGTQFASVAALAFQNSASPNVTLTAQGQAHVGLAVVAGHASPTANLTEWRTSGGTATAGVLPGLGLWSAGSYNEATSTAGFYCGIVSGTPRFTLANGNSAQNCQIDNLSGTVRFICGGNVTLSASSTGSSVPNGDFTIPLGGIGSINAIAAGSATPPNAGAGDPLLYVLRRVSEAVWTGPSIRVSGTTTGGGASAQPQFTLNGTWATEDHATRKARLTLAVFDTATREVARAEADGSRGYWIQTAHATAPADALLPNGSVAFYDNGSGSLAVKLKDSGGTVRTGTVTLT